MYITSLYMIYVHVCIMVSDHFSDVFVLQAKLLPDSFNIIKSQAVCNVQYNVHVHVYSVSSVDSIISLPSPVS